MIEDPIREVTKLMKEQAGDFARLNRSCINLCNAMTGSDPSTIESLTRVGEMILLEMRARLVRIIRVLTSFAESKASAGSDQVLDKDTRAAFEAGSRELLQAAEAFHATRNRAAALTTFGSTFAAACIEVCGIKPSTYNGPYARNGETRPWA
jgi:hypothetical protein